MDADLAIGIETNKATAHFRMPCGCGGSSSIITTVYVGPIYECTKHGISLTWADVTGYWWPWPVPFKPIRHDPGKPFFKAISPPEPQHAILLAKPTKRTPGWWPMNTKGKPKFVQVDPEGGWFVDDDANSRRLDFRFSVKDLKEVKNYWENDYEKKIRWEYQVILLEESENGSTGS